MSIKVMIAENNLKLRTSIRDAVTRSGDCEVVGLARDGQEAIQIALESAPQIALVSHDLPGIFWAQTCEMLSAITPDMMTVLMFDADSIKHQALAMRSGARACISLPIKAQELSSIIDELIEVRKRRNSPDFLEWKDPSRCPKIISVTSAKGGVGKSTISANLAVMLAKHLPGKVALVDLYPQYGDIPAMLNITPKRTIGELAASDDEIDTDAISDYITKHSSGVDVLITAVNPMALDTLTPEFLDKLMYVLKRTYRYVILDTPHFLQEYTMHTLMNSTQLFLVTNLFEVTAVADTKKLYDALRYEHIPEESINIIINRVSKSNKLSIRDIELMFTGSNLYSIPHDNQLMSANNNGTPIAMQNDNSLFVKAAQELADSLIGDKKQERPERVPVFSRILKAGQEAYGEIHAQLR